LARFYLIARGSASESEYHLLLARDLNLIEAPNHDTLAEQVIEIKRMLTVFVQKLKADR
jgi:four helix bundle protein